MRKFNIFLFFGLLLIVVSCEKDNLQPASPQNKAWSSFTEMINSGIDLQSLSKTSTVTSYELINPRSSVVTFFTDPADFGCSGLPTEDFEEGPETQMAFLSPLDEFSDNLAFSPGDILPGVSMYCLSYFLVIIPPPTWGLPSKVVGPNYLPDSLTVTFSDEGVNSVSLNIYDIAGDGTPVVLRVFGMSGLLGTASVPSSEAGVYLGMQSSEPITSILVWSPSGGGELIDNLAFGTCDTIIDGCDTVVPEYTFEDGDTMLGLIMECAADAKNHGQFVSCVSHLLNEWKKDGLITGDQKEMIMDCIGAMDLP